MLHLTALGVYEATANGQPVSTAVLEPPHTDYRTRLVYATYDITGSLRPGDNALSVEVGPGLAHVPPTPGRYQKLARSDGPPRLLAQLEICYADGTVATIATGASWRTALGCTTFSGWYGGAIVLAPWAMYREYGDIETAREHYPAMVRYLDYLGGLAEGNLLGHGLGDWAAIDERTPVGITASFGYHQAASTMARIATLIGRPGDAARWAELTDKIGAAFNAAYFRPAEGTYGTGSQACDALALDLGVVPAADRQRVLDHLVADIRARGNHLSVGEIPLPSVLRVLSAAGRHDVIWDVVTEMTYPGYGYLAGSGATSLPEYWDGPDGHGSQNHFMLGAIDAWLTGCLAGLGQRAESVAYRDLVIRPVVTGDLTEVTAQTRTVRGVVRSHWHRTDDTFQLDVTIPPGPAAMVCVPLRTTHTQVTAPAAAQQAGAVQRYANYRVGPGDWSFRSTG